MSPRRSRLADAAVAAALFLCVVLRGLNLSSVLMPFEGWDEYAHLAVAAHVDEHGRMPNPDQVVPRSLWEFIRAHPHPAGSAAHNSGLGAQTYRQWPTTPLDPLEDPRPNNLYQAQHGPLFYHLMAVSKRAVDAETPGQWADLGRVLNVVCLALTVVVWFFIIRGLSTASASMAFPTCVALVLASNSLFLYNGARVANDALALLLASVAFLLYGHWFKKESPLAIQAACGAALVLGAVLGSAVLAKTTVLSMAPVLAIGVLIAQYRGWQSPQQAVAAAACVVVGYFAVTGIYHWGNVQTTGGLFGMQEAVHNRNLGRSAVDVLAARHQLEPGQLRDTLLYGMLHVGGWSGLRLPTSVNEVFRVMLYSGPLLLLVGLYSQERRQGIIRQLVRGWELPMLYVLVIAAQLYHILQSQTAWGHPTTGTWYGLLGLPPLLWMMLVGPAHIGNRTLVFATGLWVVLFTTAFYWGAFGDHVPFQTQGMAVGLVRGIVEVHAHHEWLRWPTLPSVLAEVSLQLVILIGVLRPAAITSSE